MNEPIKGVFYEPELQKVEKDENALWFIEKKLRKRKRTGKIMKAHISASLSLFTSFGAILFKLL
jgi:hypothetical protein